MINKEKLLFDFLEPQEIDSWRIINDGVMGGVSRSNVTIKETGVMTFYGEVSLENNGGFASTRTLAQNFGLTGFKGIQIRVKGEGKTYQFRVKLDANFDGINYKHDFIAPETDWKTFQFLFDDFQPIYRGRILEQEGILLPKNIRQLGFLISNKQAGPFKLDIDWIKAY